MPDFAMTKTCFINLLQTVIKNSFLLVRFATIILNHALHYVLYTQAVKLHKRRWFAKQTVTATEL